MIVVGVLGYACALACVPLFRQGLAVIAAVGVASLLYGTLAPSLKTYVTLARPHRREHALAYLLMAQSIGWLSGSWSGGYLYENALAPGFRLALAVCGTLLVGHAVASVPWLADLRRPPLAARERRGWFAGLLADLVSLYENPRLLRLCAVSFFTLAGNYIAWGFFSVYYTEHLGAGMRVLGITLAISAATGIAAYFAVGPVVRRFGGARVLPVVVTLYIVMYLGMALVRNQVVLAALFAMPLYGFLHVSTNALAADYSSTGQRGGGLGVLNGVYALGTIAGPITCGLFADARGLWVVPWTAVAFLLPAAGIAWIAIWRSRPVAPNGRKAG
jgi:predicted MFS family arabinose efflux permease